MASSAADKISALGLFEMAVGEDLDFRFNGNGVPVHRESVRRCWNSAAPKFGAPMRKTVHRV
jgi:hypothetical protein